MRSIVWTVYAPSFLLAVGQGLVLAAIPLLSRDLGANFALIGVAVGALRVGTMTFDVPAGLLVSRYGRKRTMLAGTLGIAVFSAAAGMSGSLPAFILLRFATGAAMALWSISRQTYIADVVPLGHRGRALALFGGASRLATIIGPVIGGAIALQFGLASPLFGQSALAFATVALVATRLADVPAPVIVSSAARAHSRLIATVRDRRRDFATAGVAAIALQLIRNARQTLIPLWGDSIGLDIAAIGSVMSVSSVVDSTLFYPVGIIMDRWGRKWAIVPSLLVLSSALALIPVTHSFAMLVAVGVLAGVGNGLGSGAVFTLGVDLAPRERAGEFIGVWRLFSDAGGASGPFIVGWIAQAATLATAAAATGAFGYLGALLAVFLVRETLVRRPHRG